MKLRESSLTALIFTAPGYDSFCFYQDVTFSCVGTGGYPSPEVVAWRAAEDGTLVGEQLVPAEIAEAGDTVTSTFTLRPGRQDCGRYVKCFANQHNPVTRAGLFVDDQDSVAKKVTPQPASYHVSCNMSLLFSADDGRLPAAGE